MDSRALRIIVAGSHSSSSGQMLALLDRLGYNAIATETGEQALALLETIPADLIILDGHLPARDVIACREQIKRHQQWSNTPVIIMAARHSKTSHDEYIGFGYEELLTTPFDLRQMHTLIQTFLATGGVKNRQHPRIRFDQPVKLRQSGKEQQYQPLNLSEGGIYLKTDHPLPIGTYVEISLPVAGGNRLPVVGLIVHQKGTHKEVLNVVPGMAIKFQKSDDLLRVALADYITETALKGLPSGEDSIISRERQV